MEAPSAEAREVKEDMQASILCGVHYEGHKPHFQTPPVAPAACEPEVARQTFDHWLSYAAFADEVGFDWVSVSEHHYSPLILAPSVAPLAGALTQIVKRARIALLGPLVAISNPVRIAEEIAILDQLSHGRLIVLPLRGTPNEWQSYAPIDGSRTQGITQEATRLIQKALSEPEPFSWEGEYFQFPKVAVWPRAIQQPFPPMYSSGNSLPSVLHAGRAHLGLCISFHRPAVVADFVAKYRAEAAAAGWEPPPDQIVYRAHIVVADTQERADELEAAFLSPGRRFLLDGPTPSPGPDFASPSANGAVPTAESKPDTRRMLFAGTPEFVTERIRAFQELTGVGVVDLIFGGLIPPADIRRSIELFGREVLPRIHEFSSQPSARTAAPM